MNPADQFRCFTCQFTCNVFSAIIDHSVIKHPESELKVKTFLPQRNIILTKNFGVVPMQLKNDGFYIHSNNDKQTIRIGKTCSNLPGITDDHDDSDFDIKSPLCKKLKLSTSTPKKAAANIDNDYDEDNDSFDAVSEIDQNLSRELLDLSITEENNNDSLIKELQNLVPTVITELGKVDQHVNLLKFCRLVANGVFPLQNIGFLLFMDIVNWYSVESTSQMRYSEEVKRFWRVGMKLFKGKYLRFMSGLKNKGQLTNSSCDAGKYNPIDSQINFAVPSRQILDAIEAPVDASKPGILTDMIDQINLTDPNKQNTYKLCVDGKKINSGVCDQKLGDINLWGNENSPTLLEREMDLSDNMQVLKQLERYGDELFERGLTFMNDIPDYKFNEIITTMRQCISLLSKRLHELRKIKVGQNITLEKLLSQVTGDWRVSRLGFAISAIRSRLCEIDSTILDLLYVVDDLCESCSCLNQVDTYVKSFPYIELGNQVNFVCLQGIKELEITGIVPGNDVLSVIEQRSNAWFAIRKKAVVTGSTFYRALGFDGLKKQKQHFESFFNNTQEEQNEETLKRMKHGSENELNAVATLVSKVLPTYYPKMAFYEEGCYALSVHGMGHVIVSPDGSLREQQQSSNTKLPIADIGIEIKCPYPGKKYTTPCQYTLPVYYVPQVLCEMHVLGVETLLFVSYSEQSTTVLKVRYDDRLFQRLIETAHHIYSYDQLKCPKRIHPQVKPLREQMKEFVRDNVDFVCEVMSTKAKKCQHLLVGPSEYLRGTHTNDDSSIGTEITSERFQCMIHKSIGSLQTAYNLSRRKATEVLVFLIANTDRINNYDIPYTLPIAYGLKGYSMSTTSMRGMIDQVLKECYERGLYVPVVSFDGQWNNIAIRDDKGNALTLLQLQKDVFLEAKKETKGAILQKMNKANVVKVLDMYSLEQTVDIAFSRNENGFITSPICIKNVLDVTNEKFSPSIHMYDLIKKESESKLKPVQVEMDVETSTSSKTNSDESESEYILSTLPDDVIIALDENLVSIIEDSQLQIHDHVRNKTETLNLEQVFNELEENSTETQEQMDVYQSETTAETDEVSTVVGFSDVDYQEMLMELKQKGNSRWQNCEIGEFVDKFKSSDLLNASFMRKEIQICLKVVAPKLKANGVVCASSWPKYRIVDLFDKIVHKQITAGHPTKRKTQFIVKSLSKMCQKVVSNLPKSALNSVFAEHIFPSRLARWRKTNPFEDNTVINGMPGVVNWYCKPTYIVDRFQTLFHLLDPHHLFTNARVKCCSSGIKERKLNREAWLKIAKDGNTKLSIAHVEDLVDRQSDSFAHATFSEEVENEMIKNGFHNEANFCKLIREWYEAEDSPGISALDRCQHRMNFRNWLLEDVHFNLFPPPGSHVRGVPLIMFEGLMTNIDRRLQLFPFIKSHSYNVRAFGSLEAENLFGEFQDLDPKGVGVLRPDDVPCAISTACELLSVRMDDQKPFLMQTSKAKVYPAHLLLNLQQVSGNTLFLNPSVIQSIQPNDHVFDSQDRAERKHAKRKRSTISKYGAPCKGIKPIRQHHRCDEEKILPHKRLGIDLKD